MQLGLTDEKIKESLYTCLDSPVPRLDAAEKKWRGILANISDSRMNSDGNPTANEHLRSIIRDKNVFVRLGAKHGSGQLSVEKHIGGVNEDCIPPTEIPTQIPGGSVDFSKRNLPSGLSRNSLGYLQIKDVEALNTPGGQCGGSFCS